ncbi:hypothetical protein Hanom_Chr04g00363121 [Helianthus anomalus]
MTLRLFMVNSFLSQCWCLFQAVCMIVLSCRAYQLYEMLNAIAVIDTEQGSHAHLMKKVRNYPGGVMCKFGHLWVHFLQHMRSSGKEKSLAYQVDIKVRL